MFFATFYVQSMIVLFALSSCNVYLCIQGLVIACQINIERKNVKRQWDLCNLNRILYQILKNGHHLHLISSKIMLIAGIFTTNSSGEIQTHIYSDFLKKTKKKKTLKSLDLKNFKPVGLFLNNNIHDLIFCKMSI